MAIVASNSHYQAAVAAGLAAVRILDRVVACGALTLGKKETGWLERTESELQGLPADEATLLDEMRRTHAGVFDPASYALI